jgi:hypothetical protein
MAVIIRENRYRIEDEIMGLPSEGGDGKKHQRIALDFSIRGSVHASKILLSGMGQSRLMQRAELRISDNQE